MKVVHLVHSLEASTGGTARAVEWLASACAARGWETTIATCHADAGSRLDPGVEMEVFPPRSGGDARRGPAALREWWRHGGNRADLVVAHGLWQFPTALLSGLQNRATAVVPHGMLDPWVRRAYPLKHFLKQLWWWKGEGRVLNGAGAVVFTSEDERDRAREVFRPYSASEAVCPLGIADPGDAGMDAAVLAQAGLQPGNRYLLFLARLHPKKGADLLVEAWRRLGVLTQGWTLVVAGPSEHAAHAAAVREAAEAANRGKCGRVLMPGMATGALKWALLRHAAALILPSHQDNFGIAVAESLAVGTPVLLSRAVNIWREVEGDGAGMAFAPDVAGVREALAVFLAGGGNGDRAAARACFENRFSDAVASARWTDLFAGLAGTP